MGVDAVFISADVKRIKSVSSQIGKLLRFQIGKDDFSV